MPSRSVKALTVLSCQQVSRDGQTHEANPIAGHASMDHPLMMFDASSLSFAEKQTTNLLVQIAQLFKLLAQALNEVALLAWGRTPQLHGHDCHQNLKHAVPCRSMPQSSLMGIGLKLLGQALVIPQLMT